MKSTSVFQIATLLAITGIVVLSCQKEIGFQNNGSTNSFISSWSFTHNGNRYTGCIGSAYYEMINGIKALSIKGSDSRGNSVSILVPAPDGKLVKGTYSAAQGAALAIDSNSHTYISDTSASSFIFTVTAITDTSIQASFTATLKDGSISTYSISNGAVSALIGKNNVCSQTASNGSLGNSGGTSSYSLIASGTNCSDVSVAGSYDTTRPLNDSNRVAIKVDVAKIGTWSITTATVNGMKFAGSGTFTNTGAQTIVLVGSGIPKHVERTGFEITAGLTNCTFFIPIIAIGTPPCSPSNNTAEFSGVTSDSYSHVVHDTTSSLGGYTITANGSKSDISLQFPGPGVPAPGIYHIKPVGGVNAADDVAVYAVANSVLWQSSRGNVYVTIANGKITAVICSVPFTRSLGGSSFTTKLTAKITEN